MTGWKLVESATTINQENGSNITLRPGDYYPFFAGSKFSLTSQAFFMKSYGVPVKAATIPNGLQSARAKYAGRQTGSVRIRWNGDTIAKVADGIVYLGKMVGVENEIFPGVILNRTFEDSSHRLWAGPQSHLDIGERWVVPLNERPKLVRKGRDRSRHYSTEGHPKTVQRRIDYTWKGGRVYFTFNGYVVAPIGYPALGNRVDVLGDLASLNEKYPVSANMVQARLKRSSPPIPPYPMVVLGKLSDDSGNWEAIDERGPQPDLSKPMFDEEQLGN